MCNKKQWSTELHLAQENKLSCIYGKGKILIVSPFGLVLRETDHQPKPADACFFLSLSRDRRAHHMSSGML